MQRSLPRYEWTTRSLEFPSFLLFMGNEIKFLDIDQYEKEYTTNDTRRTAVWKQFYLKIYDRSNKKSHNNLIQ